MWLRDDLGITIGAEEIAENIRTTFTNLKWAGEHGFADFYSARNGKNSSWEYRIVFAVSQSETEEMFSLVATINLEADIKDKSTWWGLEQSSSQRFTAHVTAMKLLASEGFVDPIDSES
jgi:hypothetical protein